MDDPAHTPADSQPDARARPAGWRRAGLFFLAFASGFAVLAIEIAGARLIAPVFGLSAVPWTAVIGVILGALAVGSHLGGRLADSGVVPLSGILVAAAFTALLPIVGGNVPWIARSVLGVIPGALASAVILFAPSVLCLGAVVPYLVQADTEDLGNVGRRAGDVSAAATAGSIVGTFMTGFVLLPLFPLPVLMGLTAAGLLVLAALAGVILGARVRPTVLVVGLLAVGAMSALGSALPTNTLLVRETLYASVRVTERDWDSDGRMVRELWQNGGSSSAEFVATGEPAHEYALASLELIDPVAEQLSSVLVLGGAALTLPVALVRRYPGLSVDVVEIDPVVTELARDHFAYGRGEYPRIRVIHRDARLFLRESDDRYDVVYLDVFDHLLTVPWTMVTVEAVEAMAGRMEPDGLFMANVLSPLGGLGTEFLERLGATLAEVFHEVRMYRVNPDYAPEVTQNLIVVAGLSRSALPDTERPEASVVAGGRPLTDDWAPVEYLQAKVFLEGLGWN